MPTFITKAQYKKGVVKPLQKPQFGEPDEVIVTFVKYGNGEEDQDEKIFKEIEPQYRRIRREVFKKTYPRLYAKYYGNKRQNRN